MTNIIIFCHFLLILIFADHFTTETKLIGLNVPIMTNMYPRFKNTLTVVDVWASFISYITDIVPHMGDTLFVKVPLPGHLCIMQAYQHPCLTAPSKQPCLPGVSTFQAWGEMSNSWSNTDSIQSKGGIFGNDHNVCAYIRRNFVAQYRQHSRYLSFWITKSQQTHSE